MCSVRHSWLYCTLVLCLALPFTGIVTIGDAADGSSGFKRPLDLPSGGRTMEEEEEDAPESIMFYGGEFEGDCFVWCFPAYGFCGDTTVFASIRSEISAALNQLSSHATFDLIGFNSQVYTWAPAVRAASAGNKAAATAWMNVLVPVEAHYIVEAAQTALAISQAADSEYKQMVLCGSRAPFGGAGAISGALMEITAANYESIPLHTIYFSTPFYQGEESFYQQLAAMNGGTFRHVSY